MFNLFRTGVLIAALTALFMVVGYFIGGQTGIFIALAVALGTNLFAYWNADKMVLSMQNAREIDRGAAPELFDMVGRLAQRAGCRCRRSTSSRPTSPMPSPPAAIRRMLRSRCPRAYCGGSMPMRLPASSRTNWRTSNTATR